MGCHVTRLVRQQRCSSLVAVTVASIGRFLLVWARLSVVLRWALEWSPSSQPCSPGPRQLSGFSRLPFALDVQLVYPLSLAYTESASSSSFPLPMNATFKKLLDSASSSWASTPSRWLLCRCHFPFHHHLLARFACLLIQSPLGRTTIPLILCLSSFSLSLSSLSSYKPALLHRRFPHSSLSTTSLGAYPSPPSPPSPTPPPLPPPPPLSFADLVLPIKPSCSARQGIRIVSSLL